MTSTIIVRITPWRGERLIRTAGSHDGSRISTAIDGNATIEACIRYRSLPDSLSLFLLVARVNSVRLHIQNRSLFELMSLARAADRIASLPPCVLRK